MTTSSKTSPTALALQAQLPAVSPKQLAFLRGSNKPVNICEGSIRSGKTIITIVRFFMFLTSMPDKGELVIIGRTRDSVWRNVIRPMQTRSLFGPISDLVTGNHGAPTVNIMGHMVHVLGASDVQSEKVIRGLTVKGALVDEITTLPQEFFVQLLGRMDVYGAQLFGTTNPDSPAHWLLTDYLNFVDAPVDRMYGWTRWKFRMEDNPTATKSYINRKKRELKGVFYKRMIEGLWVAGEGAVFDFWDPEKHVVKHSDLPLMRRVYAVGMDGGMSSTSAGIWLGLGVDNKLYFFNEWSWTKGKQSAGLSYHSQARLFVHEASKPKLPDHPLHPEQALMKAKYTIVDSAAADFIAALRDNGVTNLATCKKDNMLEGIGIMASLIDNGDLLVSDSCLGLLKEIPDYQWDEKKSLLGVDAIVKKKDHFLDAARYGLMSTRGLWLRDMKLDR
jgi:PBSX family phage terminase large subunit